MKMLGTALQIGIEEDEGQLETEVAIDNDGDEQN